MGEGEGDGVPKKVGGVARLGQDVQAVPPFLQQGDGPLKTGGLQRRLGDRHLPAVGEDGHAVGEEPQPQYPGAPVLAVLPEAVGQEEKGEQFQRPAPGRGVEMAGEGQLLGRPLDQGGQDQRPGGL